MFSTFASVSEVIPVCAHVQHVIQLHPQQFPLKEGR